MTELRLTPRRPYLLKAMFDWIVDNELTPHLLVDTTWAGVDVPMQFVQDDKIVLNIAPHTVGNFEIGNEKVQFNARFSGVPQLIVVPMAAVLAIYTRENGDGFQFELEPHYDKDKTHVTLSVISTNPEQSVTKKEGEASAKKSKSIFNVVK